MSKEKLQFKNIQKYKHIYKKEASRHTGYMVSSKLSLPTFTAISCETKSNHDMFPPTLRHFYVFTLSFHWLFVISIFILMAVLITLDFYFTTLERNALNTTALSYNIWAIILNT